MKNINKLLTVAILLFTSISSYAHTNYINCKFAEKSALIKLNAKHPNKEVKTIPHGHVIIKDGGFFVCTDNVLSNKETCRSYLSGYAIDGGYSANSAFEEFVYVPSCSFLGVKK